MTRMSLLVAAILAATALVSARAETSAKARSYAMVGVGVTTLLILLTMTGIVPAPIGLSTSAETHGFPMVIAVVGLTAVALSPANDTSVGTIARIPLLIGCALLFLATAHPLMLAFLWAASAGILWIELRSSRATQPTARLFASYHVPSVVLFGVGAVLMYSGHHQAAVLPLLLGIVIRDAILPGHSWLPPLLERGPMGAAVAFVAPQLGVHAYLQLVADASPALALGDVTPIGAVLAAATALIAGALAAVQSDARRAVAFLMMSQSGLMVFGLESYTNLAHAGGLLTWQVTALATSALAMTVAALAARRGAVELTIPSGSFTRTPRMAVAFLVLAFASVGLPFTLGFVAEDVLIQGAVSERPWMAVVLIVASAFNAIAVMRSFLALFSGTASHRGEADLTPREIAIVTLVVTLLLIGGTFPRVAVTLVSSL